MTVDQSNFWYISVLCLKYEVWMLFRFEANSRDMDTDTLTKKNVINYLNVIIWFILKCLGWFQSVLSMYHWKCKYCYFFCDFVGYHAFVLNQDGMYHYLSLRFWSISFVDHGSLFFYLPTFNVFYIPFVTVANLRYNHYAFQTHQKNTTNTN